MPSRSSDPGSALVQRPRLLAKLQESGAALVLLNAPSGYGKSVLIEQWAERDPRPFPTLILGDEHNDPAMLVASIVAALDPIEPVAPEVAAALANPEPNIERVVLPRLGESLERARCRSSSSSTTSSGSGRRRSLTRGHDPRRPFPPAPRWSSRAGREPALAIGRLRVQRGITSSARRTWR